MIAAIGELRLQMNVTSNSNNTEGERLQCSGLYRVQKKDGHCSTEHSVVRIIVNVNQMSMKDSYKRQRF